MYQTVTSGPIQFPTSLEPWLRAPKQAVRSCKGRKILFTSSVSSTKSSSVCLSLLEFVLVMLGWRERESWRESSLSRVMTGSSSGT